MKKIPIDLLKVLASNATAMAKWGELTSIGRRDFIQWIESAKQPKTRTRRVDSVPNRLASGKRRTCCYAVVPMNLYKALGQDAMAKAQWKTLTADQKRDFSDWVEGGSDKEAKTIRVAKSCVVLAAGKRNP